MVGQFDLHRVDQSAALPDGIAAPPPAVDTSLILPQVEELIRATGADIRIGGDKAYSNVAGDYIRVPPPRAFFEPINWHRTALHEVGHYAEVGIMPRRSSFPRTRAQRQRGISA